MTGLGKFTTKDESHEQLSIKAAKMYAMLKKIADGKEVWTTQEVKDLLSTISGRSPK